jgi:hypothetical protein
MPIVKQEGELTTVTVSPQEEQRIRQFERQAIEANLVVAQHGGAVTMLEQQNINNIKSDDNGLPNYLKLHQLMKKIAGGGESSYSSYVLQPTALELHSAASTTTAADNSVTNKQNNNTINNNNLVLRNLMKKICSATGPTFL